MSAFNKSGKTAFSKKSKASKASKQAEQKKRLTLRQTFVTVGKIGTLAVALAGAVLITAKVDLNCSLTSIGMTRASVHAIVDVPELNNNQTPDVYYRLERMWDSAVLRDAFLPELDLHLRYDNLEPNTRYRLTFYTRTGDQSENAPIDVLNTLLFTTLDENGNAGNDQGPENGRKPDPLPPDDPQPDPDPEPDPDPDPMTLTLAIDSAALPEGREGVAYSASVSATYNGTEPIRLTASGLPSGLSMSESGEITGTPAAGTSAGSPYQVQVRASAGQLAETATLQLAVAEAYRLTLPAQSLADAYESVAYSADITADYTGEDKLVFSADGLPQALSIDAATGRISGTFAKGGSAASNSFTVTVREENGTLSASASCTVSVVHLRITTSALPSAKSGWSYGGSGGFQIDVDYNGTGKLTFSGSSDLGGVYITSGGALKSDGPIGVKTTSGETYSVTIRVSDGVLSDSKTLSIRLSPDPESVKPEPDPEPTLEPDITDTWYPPEETMIIVPETGPAVPETPTPAETSMDVSDPTPELPPPYVNPDPDPT